MAKEKKVNIEVDEVNLEDLLILGNDKKILIEIDFPMEDGSRVKAKARIKQLTLKEIENFKLKSSNLLEQNVSILKRAFFKSNGEVYSEDEILELPLGVANAITEKILEVSGVDISNDELKNF